jgi:ABC-2 type transport system permease protein
MIAYVHRIVRDGYLTYRALFNWTAPLIFSTTLFLSPLLQLVFFVYLGRYAGHGDERFYLSGVALYGATGPCVYGGIMAISNERRYGTVSAVLLSPRRRLDTIAIRGLPYVVLGAAVVISTLTVGGTIFGEDFLVHEPAVCVLAALLAPLACTCFGLALGALGLRWRDVFIIANVACAFVLLCSGCVVPDHLIPGAVRLLGRFLPLSHAVDGLRAGGLRDAGGALANELLVAAGWLMVACVLFRVFEFHGRKSAALDLI